MTEPEVFTVSRYNDAKETFRLKDLPQALYDEVEIVMGDVLVDLHGDEHRSRRRLENRLFRRETFNGYERELFPPIIEETLKPYVAEGRAELVHMGHSMMMNLAAFTAGVDRPLGIAAETDRLYAYLMLFIEGATLAHSTGDKAEITAKIADALERWDAEFLAPSVERRRKLIALHAAGEMDEADLPQGCAHGPPSQPGQPESATARHPPGDRVLPLGRGPHQHQCHGASHASRVRVDCGPPGGCRTYGDGPLVRPAMRARDDPPRTVESREQAVGPGGPDPQRRTSGAGWLQGGRRRTSTSSARTTR